MLRDLGLANWLFDIDDVTAGTLAGALLAIQRDYPEALASVASAMQIVHQRQTETMAVVRGALERHRKA